MLTRCMAIEVHCSKMLIGQSVLYQHELFHPNDKSNDNKIHSSINTCE